MAKEKIKTKMTLRSGKIFNGTASDERVKEAKTGQKRKNPKQCFESDSEDDCGQKFSGPASAETRTRKPQFVMKKCDMCGKSFRTNVHLKKHMSHHPEPDLFVRPDGLPMTFVMAPSSSKEREEVTVLVEEGGGAMLEVPQGDNWVWLLTTSDTFLGHSEAFSTAYVKECVKERRLLPDLTRFRSGGTGPRYRENPLEVLLGFTGWTDLTPVDISKPKTDAPERDIYDMGLIAEVWDMDTFESFLGDTERSDQPESMFDLIKNLENEADILDEVQEWARTELAKTEMCEYLPIFQNSVDKSENLGKPIKSSFATRPKSPDEGFESGSDEDEMVLEAKRDEMVLETQKNFLDSSIQAENCELAASVKRHKIIEMFPCKLCRKSFKDDRGRKSHLKLVHKEVAAAEQEGDDKPFSCVQCPKTFAKERYLRIHTKRCVDKSKRFPCNVCDASYADNANLKKHKLRHTKHPGFSCQHCEKTFKTLQGLRYHREVHVREHREHRDQVFPCEDCKESFAKTIYLRKVFETNTALIVVS